MALMRATAAEEKSKSLFGFFSFELAIVPHAKRSNWPMTIVFSTSARVSV